MSKRSVKLRQAQEVRDDIRVTKGAGYRLRMNDIRQGRNVEPDLPWCVEQLTPLEHDAWRRLTPGTWELAFRHGWRSV
jgi:hypothetical protein